MGVSNFPNVPIQAYSSPEKLDAKNVVKKPSNHYCWNIIYFSGKENFFTKNIAGQLNISFGVK